MSGCGCIPEPKPAEAADRFHAHLDECKQCEENPFQLCPTGQALLAAFGGALEQPAENGGRK